MDSNLLGSSGSKENNFVETFKTNCKEAEELALLTVSENHLPLLNSLRDLTKSDCLQILRRCHVYNTVERALTLSLITDYITCASQSYLFDMFRKKNDFDSLSTLLTHVNRKWLEFFRSLRCSDLTYTQLRSILFLLKESLKRLPEKTQKTLFLKTVTLGENSLKKAQTKSEVDTLLRQSDKMMTARNTFDTNIKETVLEVLDKKPSPCIIKNAECNSFQTKKSPHQNNNSLLNLWLKPKLNINCITDKGDNVNKGSEVNYKLNVTEEEENLKDYENNAEKQTKINDEMELAISTLINNQNEITTNEGNNKLCNLKTNSNEHLPLQTVLSNNVNISTKVLNSKIHNRKFNADITRYILKSYENKQTKEDSAKCSDYNIEDCKERLAVVENGIFSSETGSVAAIKSSLNITNPTRKRGTGIDLDSPSKKCRTECDKLSGKVNAFDLMMKRSKVNKEKKLK